MVAVRTLCELLQRGQDQVELLHKIDHETREILQGNSTLENLVSNAVNRLTSLIGARAGHLFLISFQVPSLACTTRPDRSPSAADILELLSRGHSWEDGFMHLTKGSFSDLRSMDGVETALLCRIPLPEHSEGVLMLESTLPFPVAQFQDQALREFVSTVALQLSNAVQFCTEWHRRDIATRLLNAFFDKMLKPSQCLAELARQVPFFLPSFGPRRLEPQPDIQILFYDEGDAYLTIRASTGGEPDITRVKVRESVCGYLVEYRPPLPFYLCDPETEPRYKWYLGRKDERRMRSELAVAVEHEGRVIAIVNFESEHINAFSIAHVVGALRASEILSPWIAAIKDRVEMARMKEEALSVVMDDYIRSFSRLLDHNMGNAATGLVLRLEEVSDVWGATSSGLKEAIVAARATAARFPDLLKEFLQDTLGASQPMAFRANGLVRGAIEVFSDLQDINVKKFGIEITFEPGEECDVYCSKIFRQHLYNVLNNSLFWIGKRLAEQPLPPGRIVVKTSRVEQAGEQQEQELNARCQITVRDNGVGASPSTLEKLLTAEPQFSARREEGGSGYGLWALRQYLNSIGGWVDFRSEQGKFFEVQILVDIFNPAVHQLRRR